MVAKLMDRMALACPVFALLPVASFLAYAQPSAKPSGAAANAEVQLAPRLPDGKVDFGGKGVWAPIWVLDWADKKWVNQAIDVPFTPEGLELFKERRANNSKDDPEGYCLPAGVPRYTGTPYPFQIIQLPDRLVILYEGASHMYRVVLMNVEHSKDPDPTWLGESVGYWEGNDTLVIDTVGFNGRTWLDYVGHPASDRLHVIEKLRRPDYRTLVYQATIDDPKYYTKPWTTSFNVKFQPGWEIKEYVCLENNKDLMHLGTKEPK
jgi:hypothetical protein